MDEILGQIHVVVQIVESHFGFNHPKFRQVTRGIGVFCPECWSKSINLSQSHGKSFAFQLSGNRQVGMFSKEIFFVIDFAFLVFGQIVQWQGSHLKHFAGTFGIGTSDDGGVDIHEPFLLEITVNGKRQNRTHSHNGSKSIGSHSQMRIFTQEFQGMFFRLHREFLRIRIAKNFYFFNLNFIFLAGTFAFHQISRNRNGCSGGDSFQDFFGRVFKIDHALDVVDGRTVVQRDKLIVSKSSYPTFRIYFVKRIGAV